MMSLKFVGGKYFYPAPSPIKLLSRPIIWFHNWCMNEVSKLKKPHTTKTRRPFYQGSALSNTFFTSFHWIFVPIHVYYINCIMFAYNTYDPRTGLNAWVYHKFIRVMCLHTNIILSLGHRLQIRCILFEYQSRGVLKYIMEYLSGTYILCCSRFSREM